MRRRVARTLVLVFALLAVAAGARALRVRAMGHYLETQRYEDVYYVPPDSWLPVFSLGHDRALADLLWIRGLVYYGQELKHRGAARHFFDYADAILTLDPRFRAVYKWAGTAGIYRAQGVGTEEIRRAVDFLQRGVERFPDDGELAWDLGATLAYELAPRIDDAEARRQLRRQAVEHLMVAARTGQGPPWLALRNASQLRELGKLEQAARHLQEMYGSVGDEALRKRIGKRLEILRGKARRAALERAYEQLEQDRKRDYPWMPAALYILVRPRPPVDEAALMEHHFLPPETWEEPAAR